MAKWARFRWQMPRQGSLESKLHGHLREEGHSMIRIRDLQAAEVGQQTEYMVLLVQEWAAIASSTGQDLYVTGDASEMPEIGGSGGGILLQIGNREWEYEIAFPREWDNTTGEVVVLAVANMIVAQVEQMGALARPEASEIIYDAQAAGPWPAETQGK